MSQQDDTEPSRKLTLLEQTVRENMPPPRSGMALPHFSDRADRLLGVLEAQHSWVMEIDHTGSLTYTNDLIEEIIGFTADECYADDHLEFHPDDLPILVATGQEIRSTGKPVTNEMRMRHKLGHWVWIKTTAIGWMDDKDDYFTLIFIQDISDIKKAEARERASEARYNVVAQMSCDLITEMDHRGRYRYIGPGSEEILGYTVEEILKLEPWYLLHPEDRERVREQFTHQFVSPTETIRPNRSLRMIEARFRHKDGRWLWFETQGVTYPREGGETRYLAVNRDVSERVLAEEQRREFEEGMQRSQKLESLGVLAGGIAHDFNNLLTPIMGSAGLGLMELPKNSPVRARMQTIHRAAKRAAALTNQMLAYAGQKPLRVERVDLTALVEDISELATASVAGKATIDLQLERDLPCVEGEAAQLTQVIMNLITNAAEALTEGMGKLTIRTGHVSIDKPATNILFAETMPLGDHVFFEVSDSGCGMDKETVERIFDPFFTTKFTGRGLGLAAVSGIVRGHRGGIHVKSTPGEGTTFRVTFPAVTGPSAPAPVESTLARDFHSTATVLVVDDDEGVRDLASEVLRRVGMTVLVAADGHEGVKLFERHPDEIDVVLLDRTMPHLSGADTFEAIQAIRPKAKIVLVSGYSEERVTAELGGLALAGFLKKPFFPETLLLKVQEVLD
ncbi:MAG: two-component system cell cycle sensor histidine kinase/response regulator CckA [Myxococcota bacterium]|jgi:two-component system cell cycle sensor histidine kinase/response regulator CckA